MTTRHLKKISSEVIHQNPRWSYKHDVCSLPTGAPTEYYYGEKLGAVITVPVTAEGKLVLVVQYRYLADKLSIEFPAGAMETGESSLFAGQRELLEETGYQADDFVSVASFEPLPAYFMNPVHIFVAYEAVASGRQRLDVDESVEVIERRVDEFEDMIRQGQIWAGPTLAAWALAREQVLKIQAGSEGQ
ncbi:MAG: NUDIX hydrolase [Candidatus Magasanikbacteria bacterium]|nr:NUDIX hydrolase [Candidatus Magasanikbacteria bacterium]